MDDKTNLKETVNPEPELVDDFAGIDIDSLLPQMNVTAPIIEKECIVDDEEILDLYKEILDNARQDRKSVDEVLVNFVEMVMNDGDSSSASKEAIVNLIKIKSDVSDKMAKVADLMTRIKLKDTNTFPAYLRAQQNNKVVITGGHREMIQNTQKQIKEAKKNGKK